MAVSRISNAVAIVMLDALVDALDTGAGTATIEIRTGSAPTNVIDARTGTLLGTLNLSNPAFNGATDANPNATVSAAAITDDSSADAAGTAGYYTAYDRNGLAVMQGDITGTGGGGAMELDNTNIAIGQVISISSWTIVLPEAGT